LVSSAVEERGNQAGVDGVSYTKPVRRRMRIVGRSDGEKKAQRRANEG